MIGTLHGRGGRRGRKASPDRGFTLAEVVIGMFITAVALLGLAQMFSLGVMQNKRSNDLSNASFLAQARIDELRGLTLTEMNAAAGTSDEALDVNSDGTSDFRRITSLTFADPEWEVQVMIFPPSKIGTTQADLVGDPVGHKVLARISTLISR